MHRESVMEQIAIAVIWQAGEVLVGPRADGDLFAGFWEFPGGKLEPGETPAAAAVRECHEETGLEVTCVASCAEIVHRYTIDKHRDDRADERSLELHLSFLACRPLNGVTPIKPPFRWVDSEQLASLKFPEANRTLIAQLDDVEFIHRFWGESS